MSTAQVTWLASLAVDAALPERTVVVRNEPVAHTWQRDLVIAKRDDLLVGTRFVTPIAAAVQIVENAGTAFVMGEEAARASRIAAMIASEELRFESLDLRVLRDKPGWDVALSATVADVEGACVDAAKLRATGDGCCVDIAMLTERLAQLAPAAWTSSRVLIEAAKLLVADPSWWPFTGHTLVEITGFETMALTRFLRAVPNTTFKYVSARPARQAHLGRVALRFGNPPIVPSPAAGVREIDLLTRYLFAAPDLLTNADRPRSNGADGTVQFEEHAGVEEEIEAAVEWVVSEVAEFGTPLEQIAIVVPTLDPYAGLIAERLNPLGPESVCVVGGLPAATTAAGARILTVLRALSSYLHVEGLADVLPTLRLASEEASLSRRDAIETLSRLGTSGGSPANPRGALEWAARVARRKGAIEQMLASMRNDEDTERERRSLERTLTNLAEINPALLALDTVASIVVSAGSLQTLWSALRTFLREYVRTGVDGVRIITTVDEIIGPLADANILFGKGALAAILATVRGVRLGVGRFGEPRVTIVALRDAVGLSFQSVRIVGLAEGSVPSNTREDPVLSDSVRSALDPDIPRAEDRALAQLHSLHRVIASARARVVLSVARMDAEGRYREPSGVLIEAAAALGRPPLGRAESVIPDARLMRHAYFNQAREASLAKREAWPVGHRGLVTRAAHKREMPPAWRTQVPFEIDRLRSKPMEAGAMDGWFPAGAFVDLPGLTMARPISASALATFLRCPHEFLFERVLGWTSPPELLNEGSIDPLAYGSLFHETAETFYRTYGGVFFNASRTLREWKDIADTVSDQRFSEFLETYPLVGADVQRAQRDRLRRDLHALLESDLETNKVFVDVEKAFGPLPLTINGQVIHLQGYIDRLDVVGTTSYVRDLKTGRAKPRDKEKGELIPSYDIQLGVYGLVIAAKGTDWSVPARVEGAYVYPSDASGDDRSFEGDFDVLTAATEGWLAMSSGLLRERKFPRTPTSDDCTFCPFKPVCGPASDVRAKALLEGAGGALAEFRTLKLGDHDG